MLFNRTYHNKSVLVTGHTGFKGSWLSLWLKELGANVTGLSNEIPTNPSNFETLKLVNDIKDLRVDITDKAKVTKIINDIKPDFIFNLAAQPLVIDSYENPTKTIMTNAIGSLNILEAMRLQNHETIGVMITSDKVYFNKEISEGYLETDEIGGKDPYSASKGMAELAIKTYVYSFFSKNLFHPSIGIARAGNVIGGGDWAKDRIIPDCVRSWSNNIAANIRNPHSTRPWQHVLEPLSGYLSLGAFLKDKKLNNGEAFNFGPPETHDYSVIELINEMSKHWINCKINYPKKTSNLSEAGLLKLNCDKSLKLLNWRATLSFEEMIKFTAEWYKSFYTSNESKMIEISIKQINDYTYHANKKGIFWAKDE